MELFSKSRAMISPSLICLDTLHILEQVRELERSGVQMLHVDILDGKFSPSMPLGFDLVRQLRKETKLAFECHVMTENPEFYVQELLDIGVEQIVFQIETADHVDGLLNKIHQAGVRAGVALKPATQISSLEYVIEKCDAILLMLINPGYASSQKEEQVPYAHRKIQDLEHLIDRTKSKALIEVDGRISLQNMRQFVPLGARVFVGGTTCIDKSQISSSINRIHQVLEANEEI